MWIVSCDFSSTSSAFSPKIIHFKHFLKPSSWPNANQYNPFQKFPHATTSLSVHTLHSSFSQKAKMAPNERKKKAFTHRYSPLGGINAGIGGRANCTFSPSSIACLMRSARITRPNLLSHNSCRFFTVVAFWYIWWKNLPSKNSQGQHISHGTGAPQASFTSIAISIPFINMAANWMPRGDNWLNCGQKRSFSNLISNRPSSSSPLFEKNVIFVHFRTLDDRSVTSMTNCTLLQTSQNRSNYLTSVATHFVAKVFVSQVIFIVLETSNSLVYTLRWSKKKRFFNFH